MTSTKAKAAKALLALIPPISHHYACRVFTGKGKHCNCFRLNTALTQADALAASGLLRRDGEK